MASNAVLSVDLVVLQSVDVGNVVAAYQVMPFGIDARTKLISIGETSAVEKRIAYLMAFAKRVSEVSQCRDILFGRIAVVFKLIEYVARGFQCFEIRIGHVLLLVAGI